MADKKVSYFLIEDGTEPYQVLAEALAFHDDLPGVRIGMAWKKGWKEDPDGRLKLGQCVKVSELQQEFAQYDFIIVLNHEVYDVFNAKQRLALVDHEVSHCGPVLDDETGEQVRDEKGRRVWRSRAHEIEEFMGVVRRHGLYKMDLERFAAVVLSARHSPLFQSTETSVEFPEVEDDRPVV